MTLNIALYRFTSLIRTSRHHIRGYESLRTCIHTEHPLTFEWSRNCIGFRPRIFFYFLIVFWHWHRHGMAFTGLFLWLCYSLLFLLVASLHSVFIFIG